MLSSFRPGGGEERILKVGTVELLGPFTTAGLGNSPSRRRVLHVPPAARGGEAPCARRILSPGPQRAYRRPVTEQDLAAPLRSSRAAARAWPTSKRASGRRCPPSWQAEFLYRAERTPAGVAPGIGPSHLTFELASRLSFFLTGRLPDEELLRAAERARSSTPRCSTRICKRSGGTAGQSLVTTFAFQWLKLRAARRDRPGCCTISRTSTIACATRPHSSSTCSCDSILAEDRSVLDFLTADYTFVNERLALHYGLPHLRGQGSGASR